MKVLVTGASGNVGSRIRMELEKHGVQVVPTSSKHRQGFVQWDLHKPDMPDRNIGRLNALVSCVGGDAAIRNMLRFAEHHRVPHIVYIGSIVTELDGHPDEYTRQKMHDERLVVKFCKERGILCSIVSPPMVFDPGNNWDKKLNMAKPWSIFLFPYFRLYLTSGAAVGKAVLRVLNQPRIKTVIPGKCKYVGKLTSPAWFFIIVTLCTLLVIYPRTRIGGAFFLSVIVLLNITILSLALIYKSANILIH